MLPPHLSAEKEESVSKWQRRSSVVEGPRPAFDSVPEDSSLFGYHALKQTRDEATPSSGSTRHLLDNDLENRSRISTVSGADEEGPLYTSTRMLYGQNGHLCTFQSTPAFLEEKLTKRLFSVPGRLVDPLISSRLSRLCTGPEWSKPLH